MQVRRCSERYLRNVEIAVTFKYNNIFTLECHIMSVDGYDKDFLVAFTILGCCHRMALLSADLTNQTDVPTPSKCQQCKDAFFKPTYLQRKYPIGVYVQFKSIKHHHLYFPLSKKEYGIQEQELIFLSFLSPAQCLTLWPCGDAQSGKE